MSRKTAVILTAFTLLGSGLALLAVPNAKAPGNYELLQSGKKLYEGIVSLYYDDINSAVTCLDESITFYPDNIETLYYLGKLNLLQGDPAAARKRWQKIQTDGYGDTYPVKWKIQRAANWLEIDPEITDPVFNETDYELVRDIYGNELNTKFFSLVSQIGCDPASRLLHAASYGTDEIITLNQNGERVSELKFGRDQKPKGFFREPGQLSVTLFGLNQVRVFDSKNNPTLQFGSLGREYGKLSGPAGVTRDPFGNLYVSETGNHRVSVFDRSGAFINALGGYGIEPGLFINPGDLLFDRDGFLYVLDKGNHRLQQFDINGLIRNELKHGRLIDPAGFSSLRDNRFYVACRNGDVYTVTDGYLSASPLALDNLGADSRVAVTDVDLDDKDYLYLSDAESNRIRIYRPRPLKQERVFLDIRNVDLQHYDKEQVIGLRLTVTDDRGRHYPNLNENNFVVYENDRKMYPVNILRQRGDKPLSVYVVVPELTAGQKESVVRVGGLLDAAGIRIKRQITVVPRKNRNAPDDVDTAAQDCPTLESAFDRALQLAYADNNRRCLLLVSPPDLKPEVVKKVISQAKAMHIPVHVISAVDKPMVRNLARWTGGQFYDFNSRFLETDFARIDAATFQEEYLVVYRTPYRNVPYKTMFEVRVMANLFLNAAADPKVMLVHDRVVYFVP